MCVNIPWKSWQFRVNPSVWLPRSAEQRPHLQLELGSFLEILAAPKRTFEINPYSSWHKSWILEFQQLVLYIYIYITKNICPQLLTYTWLNWISWTIESNLVKHVNPSKSSTKIPPQNPFNKSIQQNPSVNPSDKVCRIVFVFLPRVLDVFLVFLPGTICLVFATVGN